MTPRWKHILEDKVNQRDTWELYEHHFDTWLPFDLKVARLCRKKHEWWYHMSGSKRMERLADNLKPSEAKQIVLAIWRLEK